MILVLCKQKHLVDFHLCVCECIMLSCPILLCIVALNLYWIVIWRQCQIPDESWSRFLGVYISLLSLELICHVVVFLIMLCYTRHILMCQSVLKSLHLSSTCNFYWLMAFIVMLVRTFKMIRFCYIYSPLYVSLLCTYRTFYVHVLPAKIPDGIGSMSK